jgi:hypothetical protein
MKNAYLLFECLILFTDYCCDGFTSLMFSVCLNFVFVLFCCFAILKQQFELLVFQFDPLFFFVFSLYIHSSPLLPPAGAYFPDPFPRPKPTIKIHLYQLLPNLHNPSAPLPFSSSALLFLPAVLSC